MLRCHLIFTRTLRQNGGLPDASRIYIGLCVASRFLCPFQGCPSSLFGWEAHPFEVSFQKEAPPRIDFPPPGGHRRLGCSSCLSRFAQARYSSRALDSRQGLKELQRARDAEVLALFQVLQARLRPNGSSFLELVYSSFFWWM